MKTVVIIGSSRKDGETRKVVNELVADTDWEIIDLNDFTISYYDYEHQNKEDDYLGVMKGVLDNFDVLIFATPVYWYSMSGIMKVFFDRLTDFLTIEKEWGRKLRGKHMAVISSSNGDNLGNDFWLPFRKSANYLGMHYLTDLHTFEYQWEPDKIAEFRKKIKEKTSPNIVN